MSKIYEIKKSEFEKCFVELCAAIARDCKFAWRDDRPIGETEQAKKDFPKIKQKYEGIKFVVNDGMCEFYIDRIVPFITDCRGNESTNLDDSKGWLKGWLMGFKIEISNHDYPDDISKEIKVAIGLCGVNTDGPIGVKRLHMYIEKNLFETAVYDVTKKWVEFAYSESLIE